MILCPADVLWTILKITLILGCGRVEAGERAGPPGSAPGDKERVSSPPPLKSPARLEERGKDGEEKEVEDSSRPEGFCFVGQGVLAKKLM